MQVNLNFQNRSSRVILLEYQYAEIENLLRAFESNYLLREKYVDLSLYKKVLRYLLEFVTYHG